jgi:ATP-binding cassette subfamily B protein
MLLLNWQLALAVLASGPVLIVISLYFQRRILGSARLVRRANAEITSRFNENIMGVRTTKSLVREAENLDEFSDSSERMYFYSVKNLQYAAMYIPLVMSLGTATAGLALWLGAERVLGQSISMGILVTFMNYATLFFYPIYEMARQLTEIQMAQAAAERIQELLDTDPSIKDSPDVLAAIARQRGHPVDGAAIDGGARQIESLEFRDVGFAYNGGQIVVQSFNLSVRAGETIALVGSTGGGKSTIVNLLCRFYEPSHGQILLDGEDYRRRSLRWLQSNLGIVQQSPHLFSGTIGDNIRYGRLNSSDEEVVQAAKLAGAHDFIFRMRDGYDTEVGEGGLKLSTGQKQLVSLARAILADPQIFVMDEATSSVDAETERLIQQGIRRVLSNRTSFVIAHRLSTIRSANRILVIEQGRIVESGGHETLLSRRGRYHELYRCQWERDCEITND